jgi:hypothetical protein
MSFHEGLTLGFIAGWWAGGFTLMLLKRFIK